jgi:D-lactate dehydrogenase
MARQPEGSPVAKVLWEEFQYDGLETCAADGSCVLACPLSIDTGKLVKELRAKAHSPREEKLALRAAKSWNAVEHASRTGLRTGPIAEKLGGGKLPAPAQPLPSSTRREGAAAVYYPSCTNRIMGASKKSRPGPNLADATVAVSERAGMPVWIPPDVGGSCCGVPWSSKGHREGHAWMARQTFEKLWRWSDEGAIPVVSDASSCTLGLTT